MPALGKKFRTVRNLTGVARNDFHAGDEMRRLNRVSKVIGTIWGSTMLFFQPKAFAFRIGDWNNFATGSDA